MEKPTLPEILQNIATMAEEFHANIEFWRMLSDNPDTLRLTIRHALIIQASRLTVADGKETLAWILSIEDMERPIRDQNYYCTTSQSSHDYLWMETSANKFGSVTNKAKHNADTKTFYTLLRCYFEISYVQSGIYAQIHEKKPDSIMHEYYFAMTETFERTLGDSQNEHVIALRTQWKTIEENTPAKEKDRRFKDWNQVNWSHVYTIVTDTRKLIAQQIKDRIKIIK